MSKFLKELTTQRAAQIMILLAALVNVGHTLDFLVHHVKHMAVVEALSVAAYLVAFAALRSGYSTLGRGIAIFNVNDTVYIFSDFNGHRSVGEIFYLGLSVIPFLAFETHEKKQLLLACLVPNVLYIVELFIPEHTWMGAPPPHLSVGHIPIVAYFSTLLVGAAGLHYTLHLVRKSETELKLNQVKLIEARKKNALGEMALGMAHELNNPLTIIQGHLQRLQKTLAELPEPQQQQWKKSWDKLWENSQRIATIMAGLRNFVSGTEGEHLQEIPLKDVIEAALTSVKGRLDSMKAEIRLPSHMDDLTTQIYCQPIATAHALEQLLSNAADAIGNETVRWVQIDLRSTKEHVQLIVTDSGDGIPSSLRQQVFQPFFTTKEAGKGTGLGLAVARGTLEAQKGRLYIDPEAEETRFVMELKRVA